MNLDAHQMKAYSTYWCNKYILNRPLFFWTVEESLWATFQFSNKKKQVIGHKHGDHLLMNFVFFPNWRVGTAGIRRHLQKVRR